MTNTFPAGMTGGLDWAGMDTPTPPDPVALRASGTRFAYIRRSNCYWDGANKAWRLAHDTAYDRDAQRCRDAGIVVGAYLFPSFAKGAPSPAEQVANFVHAGGEIKKGDLPPCLDIEFPDRGIIDTGWGSTLECQVQVLQLVGQFIDELTKAFGIPPMVYTSHVQMHDDNGLGISVKSDAQVLALLAGCPLWIKIPYRLSAGQPLDQTPPRMPHYVSDQLRDPGSFWRVPLPWQNVGWVLLQWQGDARGIHGIFQADADLVNVLSRATAGTDPLIGYYKTRLGIHGGSNTWDDVFDAAVRAFQQAQGLTADAIIGIMTVAAILGIR